MADCKLLETCIFFNDRMRSMPASAELLKIHYCRGDNVQCARYMVFEELGRPAVPPDLPPNDQERARQILGAK